jgi:plasmid maintenance system antidote protein VapI
VTIDDQEEEPLRRIRAIVEDGEPVTDDLAVKFAGSAEIYVFDLEAESFALQGVVDVKVVEKKTNKFNCTYRLAYS